MLWPSGSEEDQVRHGRGGVRGTWFCLKRQRGDRSSNNKNQVLYIPISLVLPVRERRPKGESPVRLRLYWG